MLDRLVARHLRPLAVSTSRAGKRIRDGRVLDTPCTAEVKDVVTDLLENGHLLGWQVLLLLVLLDSELRHAHAQPNADDGSSNSDKVCDFGRSKRAICGHCREANTHLPRAEECLRVLDTAQELCGAAGIAWVATANVGLEAKVVGFRKSDFVAEALLQGNAKEFGHKREDCWWTAARAWDARAAQASAHADAAGEAVKVRNPDSVDDAVLLRSEAQVWSARQVPLDAILVDVRVRARLLNVRNAAFEQEARHGGKVTANKGGGNQRCV